MVRFKIVLYLKVPFTLVKSILLNYSVHRHIDTDTHNSVFYIPPCSPSFFLFLFSTPPFDLFIAMYCTNHPIVLPHCPVSSFFDKLFIQFKKSWITYISSKSGQFFLFIAFFQTPIQINMRGKLEYCNLL